MSKMTQELHDQPLCSIVIDDARPATGVETLCQTVPVLSSNCSVSNSVLGVVKVFNIRNSLRAFALLCMHTTSDILYWQQQHCNGIADIVALKLCNAKSDAICTAVQVQLPASGQTLVMPRIATFQPTTARSFTLHCSVTVCCTAHQHCFSCISC